MAQLTENFSIKLLKRLESFTDEAVPATPAGLRLVGIPVLPEPRKSRVVLTAYWRDAAGAILDSENTYTIRPYRVVVLPGGEETIAIGAEVTGLQARHDYLVDDTPFASALTFRVTQMANPVGATALELYVRGEL